MRNLLLIIVLIVVTSASAVNNNKNHQSMASTSAQPKNIAQPAGIEKSPHASRLVVKIPLSILPEEMRKHYALEKPSCPVCTSKKHKHLATFPCGHRVGARCVNGLIYQFGTSCPICRATYEVKDVKGLRKNHLEALVLGGERLNEAMLDAALQHEALMDEILDRVVVNARLIEAYQALYNLQRLVMSRPVLSLNLEQLAPDLYDEEQSDEDNLPD